MGVCACLSVTASCVDCMLAFTAVPGYHENTSVSVASAAQAAEPVTYDYTYQALPRSTGSRERWEEREEGEGRGGLRGKGIAREGRGGDVCG